MYKSLMQGVVKPYEEWEEEARANYVALGIPMPDDWFQRYTRLFNLVPLDEALAAPTKSFAAKVTWNSEGWTGHKYY